MRCLPAQYTNIPPKNRGQHVNGAPRWSLAEKYVGGIFGTCNTRAEDTFYRHSITRPSSCFCCMLLPWCSLWMECWVTSDHPGRANAEHDRTNIFLCQAGVIHRARINKFRRPDTGWRWTSFESRMTWFRRSPGPVGLHGAVSEGGPDGSPNLV